MSVSVVSSGINEFSADLFPITRSNTAAQGVTGALFCAGKPCLNGYSALRLIRCSDVNQRQAAGSFQHWPVATGERALLIGYFNRHISS